MNWELVYMSVFRCVSDENSAKKIIEEIGEVSEIGIDEESLSDFIGDLIMQAVGKKASLSPSASCRAYQFLDDSKGETDQSICDSLLTAVAKSSFQSHAKIVADQYAFTPKARDGLLFIINANAEQNKTLTPNVFVLKVDYSTGIVHQEDSSLSHSESILLPDLKKAITYPYFDGGNFKYNQLKIYQKSSADYFQKVFSVGDLPDSEEIIDKCLHEELTEKAPETYDKYFEIPEGDRRQKRELFGPSRIVTDDDLLDVDNVSHLSLKTQMNVVDNNVKPVRLKVAIDDGLKFDGSVDQLNRTYFFAQEGLERYLIVKGVKFETKSHFQTVEFMKLENLESTMNRIKFLPAEEVQEVEELEDEFTEE